MKALIVDDEPLVRERIRALLQADGEIEVAAEASNGTEAVDLVRRLRPDILFLDVQMPEMDGFAVVDALKNEPSPVVVFVTAYDEYAVRAFEVHAQDYLLKPFDKDRFAKALAYAKKQAAGRFSPRRFAGRIMVKENGAIRLLRVSAIDHVEAAGNYVCLHSAGESHILRETLADLEARLDPALFVRIHRSYLVNREFVSQLQPWFQGDYRVVLSSGATLPLSRGYRDSAWSRLCEGP